MIFAMTPIKVIAGAAAATAMLGIFVFSQPTPEPVKVPDRLLAMEQPVILLPTPRSLYEAQAEPLPPLPPAISERDRALGVAKLKAAFKSNGDKMCCGYIETNQISCYEIKGASGQSFFECAQPGEDLKPTLPDAKKIKTEPVNPQEKNELDEAADNEVRRRFMHRTFKATRQQLAEAAKPEPSDICKKHGMHKVEYRNKWRCRK